MSGWITNEQAPKRDSGARCPDIRHINRKISIQDVARELDLTFGANGNIQCWHPDGHHNGDRTASVGIRKTNNTVKCFGCGIGPLGVIDLVMAVLDLKNAGEAARWVAERTDVPEIVPGRHIVEPERRIFQFNRESEIGLLVHSGLWAKLSAAGRALVPVPLELAERDARAQTLSVTISYRALMRFGGVGSPYRVAAALRELEQIHWLLILAGGREPGSGPVRAASSYLLTPRSDELIELAHANFKQMRDDIANQRCLRAEARAKRKNALFTK